MHRLFDYEGKLILWSILSCFSEGTTNVMTYLFLTVTNSFQKLLNLETLVFFSLRPGYWYFLTTFSPPQLLFCFFQFAFSGPWLLFSASVTRNPPPPKMYLYLGFLSNLAVCFYFSITPLISATRLHKRME